MPVDVEINTRMNGEAYKSSLRHGWPLQIRSNSIATAVFAITFKLWMKMTYMNSSVSTTIFNPGLT
ncbi:hypothetical protein D1872_292810 [compost metagenome]